MDDIQELQDQLCDLQKDFNECFDMKIKYRHQARIAVEALQQLKEMGKPHLHREEWYAFGIIARDALEEMEKCGSLPPTHR
jgi:hypothetical protein